MSYSVSDIQDYFECIIKEPQKESDNPPISTYVNEIKSRIKFKIKAGYYFKFLTTETINLLGSTKNKTT